MFAGLFRNQQQVLAAAGAVLLRLGQVVNDSLPFQMPCQCLPPAAFLDGHLVRFRPGLRIAVEVIVALVGSGFGIRTLCLPGRFEQCQLLFRRLFTLTVALRFQQFAQQTMILALLGRERIQLFGQIRDDLPQCLYIPRQLFGSIATVNLAYVETHPFPSKNNSTGECLWPHAPGAVCAASLCSDRCRSARS